MRDGTRWLSEAEERSWHSLQLMQMQLTAVLNRQLSRDSGISLADYGVLVALSGQPDGAMRPIELGDELGWEKSRLSHHITRMEARQLVSREGCPSDGRGAYVVLTDRGRDTIRDAAPGHVAAVRRHFVDLLSAEQLDTIGGVAAVVLDNLACDRTDSCAGAEAAEPAGPYACGAGTDEQPGALGA